MVGSRAVLVHEAPLMHLALRTVLHRSGAFTVVAGALGVAEGMGHLRRYRPDVVICGGDGIGELTSVLCGWARRVSPQTRVVALCGRGDMSLAVRAIDAGVAAFLLDSVAPAELLRRLDDVMAGLVVVDERIGAGADSIERSCEDLGLSSREAEVLGVMSLGLDNRMIAERLDIAQETVKSHVKAVLRKLGARDRTHAVAIALGVADRAVRR